MEEISKESTIYQSLFDQITYYFSIQFPELSLDNVILIVLNCSVSGKKIQTFPFVLSRNIFIPSNIPSNNPDFSYENLEESWIYSLLLKVNSLPYRKNQGFRFSALEVSQEIRNVLLLEKKTENITLFPLDFMGIPSSFLIIKNIEPEIFTLQKVIGLHYIYTLFNIKKILMIATSLTKRISSYSKDEEVIFDFLKLSLLPLKMKSELGNWQSYFPEWPTKFRQTSYSLETPLIHAEIASFSSTLEKDLIFDLQETQFQIIFDSFIATLNKSILNPHSEKSKLANLFKQIDNNQQKLEEVLRGQQKQSTQIQYFFEQGPFQVSQIDFSENEFYKNSTGWNIRFKGSLVRLKGNYHTGLSYIHKMLQYPDRKFYPNELEVITQLKSTENQEIPMIQLSESFNVEIRPQFSSLNPEDEKEILSAFKRLVNEKPGVFDSFETHITYLSQMLYLAYNLKELASKSSYIRFYNEIKIELDDKIREFEAETNDNMHFQKILSKSKIIRRKIDYNKQIRRLRQRVSKSINNAIDMMESEELQLYFRSTVSHGARCIYTPKSADPIDWKLYLE